VARTSSGGIAICYVLPVFWMTLFRFVDRTCDGKRPSMQYILTVHICASNRQPPPTTVAVTDSHRRRRWLWSSAVNCRRRSSPVNHTQRPALITAIGQLGVTASCSPSALVDTCLALLRGSLFYDLKLFQLIAI